MTAYSHLLHATAECNTLMLRWSFLRCNTVLQRLASASTSLLYQLVRNPVLAKTDTQSTDDALKFALARWTAFDWHLIWINTRKTWISENLRYTRVRAIEKCVSLQFTLSLFIINILC
jgi:hypothetical protein